MWLALAKGPWSRLLRDLIYSLSRWFCFPEEKAPEGLLPDRGPNYWEIYQCLCCMSAISAMKAAGFGDQNKGAKD